MLPFWLWGLLFSLPTLVLVVIYLRYRELFRRVYPTPGQRLVACGFALLFAALAALAFAGVFPVVRAPVYPPGVIGEIPLARDFSHATPPAWVILVVAWQDILR